MGALIHNEIIKLVKSRILLITMVLAVLFSILLVNQKSNYLRDASDKDPKSIEKNIEALKEKLKDPGLTQEQIISYQDIIDRLQTAKEINQKKMDAFQAESQRPEVLEAQTLEDQYLKDKGMEREDIYARNTFTLLLSVLNSDEIILIFLISALLGAAILAYEYQPAVIKNLVTSSVPRWKLLTSKYLVMAASVSLVAVTFMAAAFLYSGAAYGWGTADYPVSVGAQFSFQGKPPAIYQEGSIYLVSRLVLTMSAVLHNIFVCIVTASVAFMLSAIMTRKALSFILSFMSVIGVYLFSMVADTGSSTGIINYMSYSALEPIWSGNLLSKLIGENIPVGLAEAVLTIWLVITVIISFAVFIKRDIRA